MNWKAQLKYNDGKVREVEEATYEQLLIKLLRMIDNNGIPIITNITKE